MRTVMRLFSLVVLLSFIAAGCGSGGGGGDDPVVTVPADTVTISGSVSGTTVIAVNDNGDIVATDDTAGKAPDVDENYPFTLAGIPVGVNIRVYLVTGGGIYPMYFDGGTANVFSLTSATDIVLGFVDINILTGQATPANNPTDTSGVNSEGVNTAIPTGGPISPSTGGLSLSQLITEGLDAIRDSQVLNARDYFNAAEAAAGSSVSNDADTARFFYAMTRVAALGFDTYSDGDPNNGLNDIGDILDGFGCDDDYGDGVADTNLVRVSWNDIECPESPLLPSNSPTGGDLTNFAYDVIRPELIGAVENLDNVLDSFNRSWTEPFEGETVESDYGDVLFFRAVFKAILANISVEKAYDLDLDIDDIASSDKTIEQILDEEPAFLTITANAKLTEAKGYLSTGLDDLVAAIDEMQAENDTQDNDFINLADMTVEEVAEARADIADAKNSLYGPTMILDNDSDLDNDFILDLSIFFNGLDFRGLNLLPPFTGEDPGMFPDPTFGGIIGSEIDLNEDIAPPDGIPDILQ